MDQLVSCLLILLLLPNRKEVVSPMGVPPVSVTATASVSHERRCFEESKERIRGISHFTQHQMSDILTNSRNKGILTPGQVVS